MSTFSEKTLAEQGFGACWTREVAPLVGRYEARRRRRIMVASLITGVAVGLGVVVVMLQPQIAASGILARPLNQALVLALAALAAIGAWVTLLRGHGAFGGAVRAAVEMHFASLFTADTNIAFGEVVLQDLVTDGMLHDRDYALTANYAGTYGDCRIRMIEAAADMASGHRHDRVDLLVFRITLPPEFDGETRVDSRVERLTSVMDGRPDLVPWHVDHEPFDGIFGIGTTDIGGAERILTSGFAEMLLQIQERLASPLGQSGGAQPRLAMQAANGSLVMVIETPARGRIDGKTTPADAEARARELIVQFATVPALVDDLHGRANNLPAFSRLPMTDDPQPVVSV